MRLHLVCIPGVVVLCNFGLSTGINAVERSLAVFPVPVISTFIVHPVGSLGSQVGPCKEWDASNKHRQAGWGIGVLRDGDFAPPVHAGRVASRRASVVPPGWLRPSSHAKEGKPWQRR
ncbi:hypothetical protein BDP81DRAFT_413979 [Colletotrichum phormii]|uniref:Secreted protein n=1 Tax=Colletotrichum phormii TaxID=359342 RepID=A0AAJ0EP17_9PEZI|nr:uncharacterized protein BDP81DRAFT_413979 [Colletotrichum phormii]KAK1656013.1 hypothetical protein BDP81DRAFT_413979 [Colletotrichum phormii]